MGSGTVIQTLLKGLALGFSIAAPVGPIGVLCIRRTAERGFKAGLASGLGAASADAVYGAIAAAGLTFVAEFLVRQGTRLGLLGGAFLLYLGVRTFLSPPPQGELQEKGGSIGGDYLSTFLLTLSNPVTIFSFAAIFGGLSAEADFRASAFLLVLGVFLGSALWWLALSTAVNFLRGKMTDRLLLWINRAAGVVITVFGLVMLRRAVIGLMGPR